MFPIEQVLAYARAHRRRFLDELKQFVRFPSISAQPKYAEDVRRCATWLAEHLRRIGLRNARITSTAGHPIVYAEHRAGAGRPTVLIYGHYDVQPPEPLDQWRTPPFEPVVRGEDLYGRGASDDKGQLFAHVKALESYLRVTGGAPVNIKLLFEGEEESGSSNLPALVEGNREELAADAVLISDTAMVARDRPAITCSLRGSLAAELQIRGPSHDLHSGNFGGAVHNPLQVLAEIVARLHDRDGRIAIPGFYEDVRVHSPQERLHMRRTGPTDQQILAQTGAVRSWGERGYSLYERVSTRPALTINGLAGGYQGPGFKGVIPAMASAKLSFRLVPDQDPQQVGHLLRKHLRRSIPPTVRWSISLGMSSYPVTINRRHSAMRTAAVACRRSFGRSPVWLRSGGSIPIVSILTRVLHAPVVMIGFGLPDDRIHAPNEKFDLRNFYRGIDCCIWFLAEFGSGAERPEHTAAGVELVA